MAVQTYNLKKSKSHSYSEQEVWKNGVKGLNNELNIYAVSASGAAKAVPVIPIIIAGINKNNLIKLDIINLRLNLYRLKDPTKINLLQSQL